MKISTIMLTCLLFGLSTSAAFAAGGQNQIQNPIFGDNCVEVMPPGIDAEACVESPAPAQSGVNVYFCETTTVIVCQDDGADD
jgi:hypothetical protein